MKTVTLKRDCAGNWVSVSDPDGPLICNEELQNMWPQVAGAHRVHLSFIEHNPDRDDANILVVRETYCIGGYVSMPGGRIVTLSQNQLRMLGLDPKSQTYDVQCYKLRCWVTVPL